MVGKAVGGGLPLGAYGMTAELAAAFERGESLAGEPGELATGGTLFANALSMAAARAVLTEVLTPAAYEHAAALGAELADGLEAVVDEAGLPWKVQRLWPRSGISFSGRLARDAAEADADEQPELNALLRLHLANRGVWEAISTAGPAMSVDATRDDVAAYVAAFRDVRRRRHRDRLRRTGGPPRPAHDASTAMALQALREGRPVGELEDHGRAPRPRAQQHALAAPAA